jgi:hypothetical protein
VTLRLAKTKEHGDQPKKGKPRAKRQTNPPPLSSDAVNMQP